MTTLRSSLLMIAYIEMASKKAVLLVCVLMKIVAVQVQTKCTFSLIIDWSIMGHYILRRNINHEFHKAPPPYVK